MKPFGVDGRERRRAEEVERLDLGVLDERRLDGRGIDGGARAFLQKGVPAAVIGVGVGVDEGHPAKPGLLDRLDGLAGGALIQAAVDEGGLPVPDDHADVHTARDVMRRPCDPLQRHVVVPAGEWVDSAWWAARFAASYTAWTETPATFARRRQSSNSGERIVTRSPSRPRLMRTWPYGVATVTKSRDRFQRLAV